MIEYEGPKTKYPMLPGPILNRTLFLGSKMPFILKGFMKAQPLKGLKYNFYALSEFELDCRS